MNVPAVSSDMHLLCLLLLLQFMVFISARESHAQLDRLSVLDNMDIPGGDYSATKDRTLQGCRYDCLQDERCKAYTYNHTAKVCFLKERVSKRARFNGATSGIKFSHGILADTSKAAPPTQAIIDTWARATSLCRGESKKKRETWAWCDVSKTLGVVLQLRNWCRGKKGEKRAEMVWHKCEAKSLRTRIPKSVSSRGRN